MLCHQCGSSVEATDRSCSNCGADLTKSVRRFDIASSKGLRISQELKAIRLDNQIFPPGEKIANRLVLGELIGKGPFGEVYRARDEEIDTDVAVKIFSKELLATPMDQERFLAGSRQARNRSNSNLVRIHESGVHKDYPWVAMQYLEGLSLRKVLNLRRGKGENFNLTEIEPVVSQLAAGLDGAGPHGNLKPENLIFMPELLKVTDHSLLDMFDVQRLSSRLSESQYLAPELHSEGYEASERADVFSIGMILGEMVFGADYAPGSVEGDLRELDTLCRRATAFDPSERYPTVRALSVDLTSLLETGKLTAEALHGPPPAPSPVLAPPVPPHSPPPPPTFPPAPVLGRSEMPVNEESISTIEYSRDADIMDVLPTTEVPRDAKRPMERPVDNLRVHTQTAIGAPPGTQKEDNSSQLWLVALIIAVLVGSAIYTLSNKSSEEEPVQLGASKTKDEKTEPVKAEPVKTEPVAVVEPVVTEPIAVVEPVVTEPVAVVEPVVVVEPVKTEPVAVVEPVKTEPVKVEPAKTEPVKTEPVKTEPVKTEPVKTEPVKTAVATKTEDVKVAATGTACPAGMILAKQKSGDVCIDVYEYPGRGTPKTKVNWFEAKKICTASGKRLCALNEWQNACGSKYPYGNSFDANACNTADEDGFERTIAATGANKKCRSRSGAYDMSGNVHEWVEEQRIAGGSFESDADVASCRYSSAKAPGSSASDIGFRCCANPQ